MHEQDLATIPQQIKSVADTGLYTTGWAGILGWIPGTWGEWAAFVAIVYGCIQIVIALQQPWHKLNKKRHAHIERKRSRRYG